MTWLEFLIGCDAHGVRLVNSVEGPLGNRVVLFGPKPLSPGAARFIRANATTEILDLLHQMCPKTTRTGKMTLIKSA